MKTGSLHDQYTEAIFKWPNRPPYVFPGEDRLDPDLFAIAAKSWEFLNDALADIRLDRRSKEWASRVLAVYYASRMHGASSGATMMIAHGFGREAIILSRCQYEYFTKMLYYDHNHEEATELLKLLGSYSFRFAESVNRDAREGLSEEAIANLERLSKTAYRGNFTTIVKSLESDPRLRKSAAEGNPFAKGFLMNAASMLKTHWKYGSSITHAGLENLPHVLVPDSNGNFTVTIDSRMKAPNKTVLDLAQRCFSATGLLRWRLDRGFTPEHIQWAKQMSIIANRHADEPTDIKSMHD